LNTDSFAGFRAHAALTANNANSTVTTNNPTTTVAGAPATAGTVVGGTNNQNGWGLGADYTYNKFFIAGAYQSYSATNPYANTGTTTATNGGSTLFSPGGANTLGQNVHDNGGYVGATYDFGILKAYANWVSRKVTSSQSSNYYVKRQAESIGVRSYITPTIETWAVAGLGRYTAFGAGQPTANFNAYQLGANYYLSKRTNLYGIFGVENTSTYSTVNANGVATSANSHNANAYALGVRHTF
jgi:predicted porin